jgi:hypothetical protein
VKSSNVFGHSSSFAFNFWGIWGWFRGDNLQYYWIDWRYWGFFLNTISTAVIIYSLRNARGPGMLALGVGLSMLAFFTFQTRMHERYMFPALLPLLAAGFYINRPFFWVGFALLSILQFLSLYKAFYHPFFNAGDPAWLYADWVLRMLDYSPSWWHRPGTLAVWLGSLCTTLTFLALTAYAFLLHHRVRVEPRLH